MCRDRRCLLASVLVAVALLAPAQATATAAAPVPVTARQRAEIVRLTGYVTQLAGFTRTISTGVEVQTARIRALSSSIAGRRHANTRRFGGRLAPVTQLATTSLAVLGALDDVESRGGHAATVGYGSAVIAFDRAVARYSAMRVVQRSR